MSPLSKDFKDELRAKANANLQRHFQTLEEEARSIKHDQPSTDTLASFSSHLQSSSRILVLTGAGLSASSGIPTYRSAGGFWRTYSDQQLAKKSAFEEDPVLIWQFYNHRRQSAQAAEPNAAHYALVELARRKPGLLSVNQNVDGLCQRAGHPEGQIVDLHGSLWRVKCVDEACGFEVENWDVPIVPQLPVTDVDDTESTAAGCKIEDLPHCPKCKNLLRPATVWFGEGLPEEKVEQVDDSASNST
ncbi:DHS-like NAD/FAD-binding domain-containing protein [Bimuria novae-zelandiae CBS 107.79]|uniref:DHS-like NAD/FAD-binding domain-containing protein n=1 Tax=Bimuria novae-zelandiae CBS 107.79 TaxID=1447943 RepID=A0A6A5VF07_9PLEO|nr:DHS-like NAD/FAD-binding domain-containing protein [Bimuria novae-zelandiae CBS 107.79]